MTDQIKLPSSKKKRWTASNKAAVVTAIREGRITVEAAVARYSSSPEELAEWSDMFAAHGVKGLHATYRHRQ